MQPKMPLPIQDFGINPDIIDPPVVADIMAQEAGWLANFHQPRAAHA